MPSIWPSPADFFLLSMYPFLSPQDYVNDIQERCDKGRLLWSGTFSIFFFFWLFWRGTVILEIQNLQAGDIKRSWGVFSKDPGGAFPCSKGPPEALHKCYWVNSFWQKEHEVLSWGHSRTWDPKLVQTQLHAVDEETEAQEEESDDCKAWMKKEIPHAHVARPPSLCFAKSPS